MCVQIRVLERSLCHVLRVSEWNPQWGEEAQGTETPNAGKGTLRKPRGDVWHASGSPRNPARAWGTQICSHASPRMSVLCHEPGVWMFPPQVPEVSLTQVWPRLPQVARYLLILATTERCDTLTPHCKNVPWLERFGNMRFTILFLKSSSSFHLWIHGVLLNTVMILLRISYRSPKQPWVKHIISSSCSWLQVQFHLFSWDQKLFMSSSQDNVIIILRSEESDDDWWMAWTLMQTAKPFPAFVLCFHASC